MKPTLAIVTSCWNYGKYLLEWAQSIVSLTVKPDLVVIWCHGNLEVDRLNGAKAAALLEAAGLRVLFHMDVERVDFGVARNAAVALADSEWVMHLDADDQLMPHALEDWLELAEQADVVCFGYERSGDLRHGPRVKSKLYKSSQGPTTLANPTPCSGVSPFRRALWDLAPYPTDLIGGWDTALWLGFAHLGARFVPTRRPCFWYRQHRDSIFLSRLGSGWPAHRAGTALQSIRAGHRGVSLIIPRSISDTPDRVAAWTWLRQRYEAFFPDWQIVEGYSAGRWIKGAAVNEGLKRATGKYLVIADADCVIEPEVLRRAVELVQAGAPWVVPHRLVHRLNESLTATALAREPGTSLEHLLDAAPGNYDRAPYIGFAGGGIVVVSRAGYVAAGGFPAGFIGWGAEDEALAAILDTLLGKHQRLDADLVHLFHLPQAERAKKLAFANRHLWLRYRNAIGNVAEMWRLVRSPQRGPTLTARQQLEVQRARQGQARAQIVAGLGR